MGSILGAIISGICLAINGTIYMIDRTNYWALFFAFFSFGGLFVASISTENK